MVIRILFKEKMMVAMIAFCGLACDTCPIHLATLEQDDLKQQTMRAEIARLCMEQYGMNFQTIDITDCDGCRTDGRLFSGCTECVLRKCAMGRELASCAFCDEYICENLQKHFEMDSAVRTRLDELRAVK
jgi:hypothetical protein